MARGVAALAADPLVERRAGRVFSSWELARDYDFDDADGARPHWREHFARAFGRSYALADEGAYASWRDGPYSIAADAGALPSG